MLAWNSGLYPTCRVILPAVSELHRGVMRMARSRSPWRALRPVLLAGAATLTWLTFSSTAASADTLSETSSLLGGVTSSVSAVSEKLVNSAPGTPSASSGAQSPGLLKPVVTSVSDLADNVIVSVPVVHRVVPAGTVAAVTAPVVEIADGATSAVVETVVAPITETVPVLEPVLDPVKDLITGATPIPVPGLPGTATGEGTPGALDPVYVEQATAADTEILSEAAFSAASTESSTGESAVEGGSLLSATTLRDERNAGTSAFQMHGLLAPSSTGDSTGSDDPSPRPGPVPAAPGVSGTGSGASSAGGSSGSAAWLHSYDFHLPLTGDSRDGDFSQHIPAPVSFDPGSSPD